MAGSPSFCWFSRLLVVFLGLPAGFPTPLPLCQNQCFCGGVSVDRYLPVFRTQFILFLSPPFGGSVEGADCHFLRGSRVLGRFRPGSGGDLLVIFMLAVSAAGLKLVSVAELRGSYPSGSASARGPWEPLVAQWNPSVSKAVHNLAVHWHSRILGF